MKLQSRQAKALKDIDINDPIIQRHRSLGKNLLRDIDIIELVKQLFKGAVVKPNKYRSNT